MDKNIIIFLIKLFGTFAFLIFVIVLGKELKSHKGLNEDISHNSLYLEIITGKNKQQHEIKLQIQLKNKRLA